ncbi:MAG: sulfur oxidation c-type cytochrome SoxA [Gammaproteobacteria bacterium]|nr:sulfur oxidation c-type cytochrome SoxA [Gammaproteobacteria bacterium]MBT8133807.1 sulfur oxidation c-type cytochrome SoxA [Gammaproteobacteria bacterium]NNJ49315.1 sulfur oxidation c-type cytochrome SoxA [Gammaproteobacteria bacterium]
MKLDNKIILIALLALLTTKLYAEPVSGYEYIKPETRTMQDDDFSNPGLLAVDRGQELFNKKYETDKTCSDCHGKEGEMFNKKRLARYPMYRNRSNEIITLQKRIRNCQATITENPLQTDHPDLISLETFVRNRAHGEIVNIQTEGPVAEEIKEGEKLYTTRYGLIDMSCQHCHDFYPGQMIRGQKISQGQANGFPAYRLATGEMANLHLRIQQCMTLLRAEPFATDSKEIEQLGLYLMSRSNGLAIETPAVRY